MVFINSFVALAILSTAQAHVVMNTPEPYNFGKVQTAPLGSISGNFPCGLSMPSGGASSGPSVSAGGTQKVAFTGAAVHGGGVCQFSVTYENPPPKDITKWKVIHTIMGGCPSQSAGNIATSGSDKDSRPTGVQCGNDSGTECLRQFDIPIPKELKNGAVTFAWTWFNLIGNREMYMNCAPLTITGGSGDDSFMSSLPNPFVANSQGATGVDSCTTGQGLLDLPFPGKSVKKNGTPASGSMGSCKADNGKPAGGAPSGGSPPAASSAPAASAPASSAPAASAPASSAPAASAPAPSTPAASAPAASTPAASKPAATLSQGGVFAPGASDVATSYTTVFVTATGAPAASAPAATSAPAPNASAPAAPAPSGSAPASGGEGKVPCSTDGAIVCISETQFGLCDRGFAVPMAVAAGTKCQGDKIVVRALPRRALHRRHHHNILS